MSRRKEEVITGDKVYLTRMPVKFLWRLGASFCDFSSVS
jgi:hypothetical protein